MRIEKCRFPIRTFQTGSIKRLRRCSHSRRADLVGQRRMSGGQQRDRHAVRRTAHVIQPDLVAEDHLFGVAAVLAADADLQIGARRASVLDADFEELPHAFLIERLKRVVGEDLLLDVEGQEAARIVAARGNSIIVPTRYSTDSPSRSKTSLATRRTTSACSFSSFTLATRGIMISGLTTTPSRLTLTAASKIARACISVISG